ncbi:histidine triad nucleotide-binding protein [Candidatus Giovannonibacteria bacterium]|nr:histidine triad nucleotide-binding protein [Candidatus Giovannonibacteria bacterium]
MDCLFCKIANKEIPAEKVFEGPDCMAVRDIRPKAPVHILIIPKKHIDSVKELKSSDLVLAGEMIGIARDIAERQGLEGYKLIFNVGPKGGQIIGHIHLHLLGGWESSPGNVEV